jgi:hypothetical protein
MNIDKIAEIVAKHGFPIISAVGMSYFVYYIWTWATTVVKPCLSQANVSAIDLIDRIRRLDLDITRLHEKVDVAIQVRERYDPRQNDRSDIDTNKQ